MKKQDHRLAIHLAVWLRDVKRTITELKKNTEQLALWLSSIISRKLLGDDSGDFQEVGPKSLHTTQETCHYERELEEQVKYMESF